jgi:5'-nucleotidase
MAAVVLGLSGVASVAPHALADPGSGDVAIEPTEATLADVTTLPVHIFTFNDFHGRIDDPGITLPFVNALQKAVLVDNNRDDSMVVSAGDNIGASLFNSAIAEDVPTIQLLNDLAATDGINFKASAVGNHEFDTGFSDLRDRVIGSNGGGLVQGWEYLGANVVSKATGQPVLKPYSIYTLGNGLTVGVVAAVTEGVPSLVTPAGIAELNFTDPVAAVNTYAAQLKDGKASNGEADIVLAVYHEGASVTSSLDDAMRASEVFTHIVNDTSASVDAIVNGHTHQLYSWTGAGEQDPQGMDHHQGRPVVQAASYGTAIGQIDLTVNATTKAVLSAQVGAIPVTSKDPVDLSLGSMQIISNHVKAAVDEAKILGAPTVASVAADITTAYTGGEWVSGTYRDQATMIYQNTETATRDDRASESSLARLAANAFLDTAETSPVIGGADIGIINAGGGLRNELLYNADGTISYGGANAIMPFANNLWTVELTGAQFKQFLEEQWQTWPDGTVAPRPFVNTGVSSNVSYTVNTDVRTADPCTLEEGCAWNDPGSHVTSVFINGEPLDPERTYKIITISYLISGGDNYRVMAEGSNPTDTGLLDRDAWIDYLKKSSGVTTTQSTPTKKIEPDFMRPSVVVSNLTPATAPMQATTVTAGQNLTASLSRLDLTSLGSPANTTIVSYLNPIAQAGQDPTLGVELGTSAVTAPGDQAGCQAAGVPAELLSYSADATAPSSNGCAKLDVTIPTDTAAGDYIVTTFAWPSMTMVMFQVHVDAAPVVSPVVPGASAKTGGQVISPSRSQAPVVVLALAAVMVMAIASYRLTRP